MPIIKDIAIVPINAMLEIVLSDNSSVSVASNDDLWRAFTPMVNVSARTNIPRKKGTFRNVPMKCELMGSTSVVIDPSGRRTDKE
tara:strand:- start:43089 stop:43343 length:255 start_codon:yes stop_codon:yes gene_type:complete